ncbi:hypothetical protein PPL_12105 [Heterostelium album PN500]|uniref:Uncharacterized protein n=1 Tax=Heterostelium pallidum (strain ATCC 26659 / Pp 5 / PN500) TaxID=670386 RepID=D3BLQ2_HETP5|nr:hypothetical protein PPL_12105 [Heterostelium album PN500]EFA77503.1 hypothetical protein PPL_12105 [Heterostelium album PN500]|eukprot:XP_020429631.1 hypothetical protein PPL_12105 [Heterostelium album PN500]
MLKYTILAIFALLALSEAAFTINVGQYNWYSDSPCSKPILVNVTFSNGQYSSFRATDGSAYLRNITLNSDSTFTGIGNLYTPGSDRITGYTTVKGVVNNPFNLLVVYNPSSSQNYPGSTQYYNLASCSNSLLSEESHDNMSTGRFE